MIVYTSVTKSGGTSSVPLQDGLSADDLCINKNRVSETLFLPTQGKHTRPLQLRRIRRICIKVRPRIYQRNEDDYEEQRVQHQ